MDEKLKIVQGAPLAIEVSPRLKYAGTERIIYILNKTYHELGHESFVAGPGNCDLNGFGKLITTYPRSLWEGNGLERNTLNKILEEANQLHFQRCTEYMLSHKVDIWHDHLGESILSSNGYVRHKSKIKNPIVTTIHGDIVKENEIENWRKLRREGFPIFFVAISNSHKARQEKMGITEIDEVVYNGIPVEMFDFSDKKQDYLFWIGRISKLKGTDIAVQVAKKTKQPLIIAGEVHSPDKEFYEKEIKPNLTHILQGNSFEEQEKIRNTLVDRLENMESIVNEGEIFFIGALDDRQKAVLYKHAKATLMPNRWEEPFGLVIIESMAAGTPVIGTAKGSLPEIIKHGYSGYLVEPLSKNGNKAELDSDAIASEIVDALENIKDIKPIDCRNHVENNFNSEIMGKNYINFYKRILNSN